MTEIIYDLDIVFAVIILISLATGVLIKINRI